MRSRIEEEKVGKIKEFDLIEEYIQIYFTASRAELLQFIKEKAQSELNYYQIKSLLASCEILAKNDSKAEMQENKDFQANVDIFFKDFFETTMINQNNTSHNF